jgi:flagellar M-ring protein FliF
MKLAAFIKSILKRIGEFFQNIEKKKLIMYISLAAVILAVAVIGTVLLNRVKYTVLYSGLDASEAGTIKTVLDGKGVTSKVQGTSTILVPEDQADTLRIELASEGYPNTGLNYDIFSNSTAIGSTDLERRTYLQYQLQENMSTAISHFFEKVKESIVIVNLASDSSFVVSDNTSAASVAVMLKLKNGEKLTNAEAKTIGEFVMKCVPDLKPENVSIVDSKMNYYDIQSNNDDNSSDYSSSQQELTQQMKDTLAKQALQVLEPSMGTGNVAVSVNLSLNFDKQTVSKVEFSPPIDGESSGLTRSNEETYNASGTGTSTNGSAGTDSNGVGTPAYAASASASPGTDVSSTKTTNYELNEIKTQIDKAQGTIQDLSVAVLVNSKVQGADGYVDTIKNLVAKSIGVKPDYISVELMPFVDNNSIDDAFQTSQKTAQQISMNNLIKAIVTIIAVAAIIIVIAKLFAKRPGQTAQSGEAIVGGKIANGQMVGLTAGDSGDIAPPEYDLSDLVRKRSSEAEKIEELMDRYPETVAQILRSWIAEDN